MRQRGCRHRADRVQTRVRVAISRFPFSSLRDVRSGHRYALPLALAPRARRLQSEDSLTLPHRNSGEEEEEEREVWEDAHTDGEDREE